MGFLASLFGRRNDGAASRRLIEPVLGIADFTSGGASPLATMDRAAFGRRFSGVVEGVARPLRCDVLLIYADAVQLTDPGRITQFAAQTGAAIVVVASEIGDSDPAPFIERLPGVNVVLTLDRKGECFARFFDRLFGLMRDGHPMPVAWVRLAPQIPGDSHENAPETVFVCGAGQVMF